MVSFVEGTAIATAGSAPPWAGVDGLVGAFKVSDGLIISAGCMPTGWKARCGIAVGDRYMSASSIAAAALALIW